MKTFISLFVSATIVLNYCASTRTHSIKYSLSHELTTTSPLSVDVIKDKEKYEIHRGIHLFPLSQEFEHYKNKYNNLNLHQNNIKPRETGIASLKSSSDPLKEDKKWFQQVSDKALRKRNVDVTNNKKLNVSRKKQKKAKVLGRLLMNNVWSKNYEDIQDDYMEDEDDYSISVNRKKLNWEDFRNGDGASVMELIALNARHKTNKYYSWNNN